MACKLDSTGPGGKGVDYKLIWRTGITGPEGQVDYKSFGIVVLESQGLEESSGL